MQYKVCNEDLYAFYAKNYSSLAPTRQGDGALDMRACIKEEVTALDPGESRMMGTGLMVAIPEFWCGFLLPRSGLSTKYSIKLANDVGFIDSNFRNEVKVVLKNESEKPFSIERLDRIAQLAIVPHYDYHKLTRVAYLPESVRGDSKGFNSSGVK